jgi:pimeloyl-ACP methyl ester carboxylesterase
MMNPFAPSFLVLSTVVWLSSRSSPIFAAAETSLYDKYFLFANGLNFTCTYLVHVGPSATKGAAAPKNLMMLHGFPMFRSWWMPLLEYWADSLGGAGAADLGFSSVNALACDLRGYSPGASPDGIENYDYAIFANDTFELATAAGFSTFDLLGHDHGAGLAWFVAANDPDKRVESLTVMSVPHPDLFSDALCGDNVDQGQVIASNYFNQFALPASATLNNASVTELFASYGIDVDPIQFQKMLWWYNGSLSKYWNVPAVVSDEEVAAWSGQVGAAAFFVEDVRAALPMEERPCMMAPNTTKIGAIEIPTLFICGLADFALYCNNPYATDIPSGLLPNYEHANFECGHDFFLEIDCTDTAENRAVMDKITAFVTGGSASSGNGDGDGTPEGATEPTDAPAGSAPIEGPTESPNDSGSTAKGVHLAASVVLGMLVPTLLHSH